MLTPKRNVYKQANTHHHTMDNVLSRIKYPKLLLLLLTFAIAYLIFKERTFLPFHNLLLSMGYLGTFLAGILFVYGFTAAPATAILLIVAKEQNIILAGFIAGVGALFGDLIIFKFIRHSFADELEKLSKERIIAHLNHKTPALLKKYFVPVLAGFIIASPLPDEIGVSLLAASRQISVELFSLVSYLLNTAGIFIILLIGSL